MKYLQLYPKSILTFENFNSAPLSQGAQVEQIYDEGGTLLDKDIEKDITPEQKEGLEEREKEIEKRLKAKKKTSLNK